MISNTCQQCKAEFQITEEDRGFLKLFNVPDPTWCPECRFQRRLATCNERVLYKRACDLCQKDMISMHPAKTSFPVYHLECWRSDDWDETDYGQDYDFSRTFFEQFAELKNKVPRYALLQQGEMKNSEYCNRASNDKNCYLCFRTNYCEECLYSRDMGNSKDCIDCLGVQKSERVYEGVNCVSCYNSLYLQECVDCTDSYFLYNCRNSQNCFGCVNLRNKQYYIFNQPYSKEEYFKKIKEFNVHDFGEREKLAKKFDDFRKGFIHEAMFSSRSSDVTGNWLTECKDVKKSFGCRNVENSRYAAEIIQGKDCMDYTYFGRGAELVYESSNCGYEAYRVLFSNEVVPNCHDVEYSDAIFSSGNLFGCVGMRKREYCILNKQYTKEEYEELVPKIKRHMEEMPYTDKQGRVYRYGEFFPPEINHFGYNETVAQEYFPLNKEQAAAAGYPWRDQEAKKHMITLSPAELPETSEAIDDSILKEVIGCLDQGKCQEQCTTAFKVTPPELQLYKTMSIPLPRLCPNCRHARRIKKRPPLKLWPRSCQCSGAQSEDGQYQNTAPHPHHDANTICPNTFETSYSPDRPEKVYCTDCYQAEVA